MWSHPAVVTRHSRPRRRGLLQGTICLPALGLGVFPLSGFLPRAGFRLGKSSSNSKVGSKPNKKWIDSSPNLSFPRTRKDVCGRGQAEFVWDDLACTAQLLAGKREIKDRENKYKTKIKWQA